MGTDIFGWVEVHSMSLDTDPQWLGVVNVFNLVERNGALFGAFFGVSNEHNFTPLWPERGLPDDRSNETQASASINGVTPHASWALWSELETIDWSMQGQIEVSIGCALESEWEGMRNDPRYDVLDETAEVVSEPGRQVLKRIRRRSHNASSDDVETLTLEQYTVSPLYLQTPIIYRRARWRVDELLTPGWRTLFELMPLLAKQYGSTGVRLVVWFV